MLVTLDCICTGRNKVGFLTKISDGINGAVERSYLCYRVCKFFKDMAIVRRNLTDKDFRSFYSSVNVSRSAVTSPRDMPDGYETP